MKANSYINIAIIYRQTIFDQLNIMVSYVDLIGLKDYITLVTDCGSGIGPSDDKATSAKTT